MGSPQIVVSLIVTQQTGVEWFHTYLYPSFKNKTPDFSHALLCLGGAGEKGPMLNAVALHDIQWLHYAARGGVQPRRYEH